MNAHLPAIPSIIRYELRGDIGEKNCAGSSYRCPDMQNERQFLVNCNDQILLHICIHAMQCDSHGIVYGDNVR